MFAQTKVVIRRCKTISRSDFRLPAKRGSLGMPIYKGIEQSTALTSTKYRLVAIKAVLRRLQVPDLKALRRHLEKLMVFV